MACSSTFLPYIHVWLNQSINTVANGHMMMVFVNLSFLITVYLSSWHALHFFHFTHLLQKQWNVIGFSCSTWLIFSALVTVRSHLCVPFVYMCKLNFLHTHRFQLSMHFSLLSRIGTLGVKGTLSFPVSYNVVRGCWYMKFLLITAIW